MRDLVEFLTAQYDRAVWAAEEAGPARVAWLTYRDADGGMLYTVLASEDDGAWTAADGEELKEPSSVQVVYDPDAVLWDVEAKRAILALYERAQTKEQAPAYMRDLAHTSRSSRLVWMELVLLALAQPFAGRDGWKEDWRV